MTKFTMLHGVGKISQWSQLSLTNLEFRTISGMIIYNLKLTLLFANFPKITFLNGYLANNRI